jgi:hypothetical protein
MSDYLSWEQVCLLHGQVGAIRIEDGKIKSLLCGGPGYADDVTEKEIIYHVPNRKYYKNAIDSLHRALGQQYVLTVYVKHRQNRWTELPNFRVEKIELNGKSWVVKLVVQYV